MELPTRKTTVVSLDLLFDQLLASAESLRENAAHNGRMNDDGAQLLEDSVYYYQCGIYGIVPEPWNAALDQIEKERDPEFETYMRLKAKFET